MSNENAQTTQAAESDGENQVRGRKPDFYINAVSGDGKDERWTRIGAAWQNEKGYISPKYDSLPRDHDRVVFQPRAELERLREDRKQREALSQGAELSQKP